MSTWHIQLKGRVQGVGFRPFVYQTAEKWKILGWVSNGSDGVHIRFNATRDVAVELLEFLQKDAPKLSLVNHASIEEIPDERFDRFEIRESLNLGKTDLLITPDLAMCEDCRIEIQRNKDRRFRYAFTTCTHCGPRYSIMEEIPYDRGRTSMAQFEMCPDCAAEYENPKDRRHYAQTNSCPQCAINLYWIKGEVEGDPIKSTVELLRKGKIVAVKGIGGFLLLGDASQLRVAIKMRQRKNRPFKPFGMMAPNIKWVKTHCRLRSEEEEAMTSVEAPLVLLKFKDSLRDQVMVNEIIPGLDRAGFMLPYTPLFEMIMQEFGRPVIATSANVSGSPIVFKDDQALKELKTITNYILSNDREIIQPQDDSVMSFTENGQKIIHRRSRGMAPSFTKGVVSFSDGSLATGAALKSSYAMSQKSKVLISQFHGNTESLIAQESYVHSLQSMKPLLGFGLKKVISDRHPDYFTTHFAHELGRKHKVEHVTVQHHLAHFGAVLGENDIIGCERPVLGVIWDGTGYGLDGAIWGSEFFMFDHCGFSRIGHLKYFPHLSGDRMATDPRIALAAIGIGSETLEKRVGSIMPRSELTILKTIAKSRKLRSSSMGRLFDAAACLLGFDRMNSFEGEAAIWLQQLAESSHRSGLDHYPVFLYENGLDPKALLAEMEKDRRRGTANSAIAYRFHLTLVEWIRDVADGQNAKEVAFSGGVFQNGLLCDLITADLSKDYALYFHDELSPNDENVAYGQLVIQSLKGRYTLQHSDEHKSKLDVLSHTG
jgi:hydrogenase maturation protein HypF